MRLGVVLACACCLAGCYTVGDRPDQRGLASLQPGSTTDIEAAALLGRPTYRVVTVAVDGSKTLQYEYAYGRHGPLDYIPVYSMTGGFTDFEHVIVTADFDKDGTLTGYTTSRN